MGLDLGEYYYEINKRSRVKKILGMCRRKLTFLKINRLRKKLIKHGAQIGDNTCISSKTDIVNMGKLTIGKSTVITGGSLDARGRLTIGNNCIINDGVRILTATHNYNSPNYEQISKCVTIGDYVWLATDCKVLPGVEIGYGAIVGAGSVVTHSVPNMAICAGNPARIIGYRKCIHNGFPTEKLVGGDFKEYMKAIKGDVL